MSASAIPECQVLMMRLKDDLLVAAAGAPPTGTLGHVSRALARRRGADRGDGGEGLSRRAAKRARSIRGLDARRRADGVEVFHAGTALRDGELVANGGRVLNVTAAARRSREAQRRAYAAVDAIDWPDGFCRRDIGWRAVERENARS